MMQATRKRQHRSGRELAGMREERSPIRGRHETGRRYAKAKSTNLCHKGTTEEDMDIISVRENNKNTKSSKTQQLEDITVNDNNATEKAFPWLLKFNKIVCSSSLKQLLLLYTQKVLSVETSNVKLDPINLKNNINNILIFFHLYWLDIKQEIADHNLYLNKMSALLSVYIDMELKTSRQEIDLKILAALYIYLNNSEEHIFRVLIRIKHMTEKYTQICNHIFTKSLTNLKIKHQDKKSLNDVTYIRYLLAFKMWKKMEKISDRNKIDKLALELLGPRMPKLRDELKFVPSPTNPTDQENETQWLLNIDLKQTHEHFLLFEDQMDSLLLEDKIDNSAYLQCIQAINSGQNSQKNQMSLLFHRNNPTSNQEVNKDYLNGLQNNNMALSIKGNKSLEKIYLQKKKRRYLKSLKKKDTNKTEKIKKKSGKIIDIIDLTTGDEISVYSKIKRKKTEHNLKCSQIKKNTVKNKTHINPLKHSSELKASVNIEKSSNRASKSTVEKVCLEHKPIPNNKINNDIESSISNRSSLNNMYLPKSEHSNQVNNICPEFVKEEDEKFDYNSHYLKSMFHSILNQYIKAFNDMTNVLKESKTENHDVSHMTYMTGNAIGSYNNTIMPSKETLISQEKSVMDTIPLSKMCQNDNVDQHFFKQEIPINTNCANAMQKSYEYWKTMPVVKQASFCNLHHCIICNIIYNFLNIEEAIDDITKLDCIKDMEKISFFISMKIQDILHMFNATNHGECVMAKSAEKQMQYLDNKRKHDHGHGSKHPETMIKAQQGRNDCNISNETSNDRLHLFKRNKFNTDSVDMDSIDMDSVDMDSVDMDSVDMDFVDMDSVDMDSISFSNKIEILEILENVMSTETREFLLSPKQSPFELDNVYTNTFLSEKDILCNNQNNAINNYVNPIAFHLNTDNTFL